MSVDLSLQNPDYSNYVRLLFDLHRAIMEGWDESEKGEVLRDRMDEPGSRLSGDEIASLSGISADFYSLTGSPPSALSPVRPKRWPNFSLFFNHRSRKSFTQRLNYYANTRYPFRRRVSPTVGVKFGWKPENTRLPLHSSKRASELDPHNANFRYVALNALWKANPASAIQMAQAILLNWERHPPRLVLKSLDVVLQLIRADHTHHELKSFIPIFENSIFRFETSGEAENDPSLLVSSINNLDYCQLHGG